MNMGHITHVLPLIVSHYEEIWEESLMCGLDAGGQRGQLVQSITDNIILIING